MIVIKCYWCYVRPARCFDVILCFGGLAIFTSIRILTQSSQLNRKPNEEIIRCCLLIIRSDILELFSLFRSIFWNCFLYSFCSADFKNKSKYLYNIFSFNKQINYLWDFVLVLWYNYNNKPNLVENRMVYSVFNAETPNNISFLGVVLFRIFGGRQLPKTEFECFECTV